MSSIRVICPHCAFSREVPAEKVPDHPVQATCPRCKQVFEFRKKFTPAPDGVSSPLPPGPPPLPSSSPSPLPGPGHSEPPSPSSPPPGRPRPEGRPEPVPARHATPPRVAPPPRLMEVGELFGSTWDLFRRRWLVLIGLFLFAVAGAALPVAITGVGIAWARTKGAVIEGSPFILLVCLSIVAAFMAFFRGIAALMAAALDETVGFREAVSRGRSSWVSLVWVSSLYSFIVGGATLLLLIPGILTGVWFFAAPYMAMTGEARGMEALMRSRSIMRDRFWPVFLRLFLLWLLATIAGMVPFAGPILALAMVPFTLLYHILLYRNLEESAGRVTPSGSTGRKAGWLLLGLAGYLLVPLVIVSVVGVSVLGNLLPLLKGGSLPSQERRVITIPPPEGGMPDLPGGGSAGSGAPGSMPSPPVTNPVPVIEIGPAQTPGPGEGAFRPTDLSVFIYAVNAPGTIRVNGQEFKIIKAEPDMQYNINTFGDHFRPGDNTIEFDVTPRPIDGNHLSPEIHMKVSQGGQVLGDWRLSDKEGWRRSVTVQVPAGKSP